MRIARLLCAATLWAIVAAGTAATAGDKPTIKTLREIGPALSACWRSLREVGDFEVRVRLSFRSDGSVLGRPRITFSRFSSGPDEQRLIVRAVIETLATCTPLPFSTSLGGAVAGRIFVFGFVSPPRSALLMHLLAPSVVTRWQREGRSNGPNRATLC